MGGLAKEITKRLSLTKVKTSVGEGGKEDKGVKKEREEWENYVLFFYSPFWMGVMGLIVVSGVYEDMGSFSYLALGVGLCIPTLFFPFSYSSTNPSSPPSSPLRTGGGKKRTWDERHWVKSNVWIAIVSYIGNYFFTHYFYQVLGCRYTTPTSGGLWAINDVPICMYFLTHAYFLSYHVFVRRLLPSRSSSSFLKRAFVALLLAWITAFMETFTISSFPHYRYPDLFQMLTFGSTFYMLFLSVSFLMYTRLDSGGVMPMSQVIIEALATCMMVFILYDMWRLIIGGVGGVGGVGVEIPVGLDCSGCAGKVPY